MKSIIEEKAKELAINHAQIIENEINKVCEKHNCTPNDLTLEYHANTEIKIKVNATHFKITNGFAINGEEIKSYINPVEIFV